MPSSNTDVEKFIIDGADFPIVDPTARTAIGTTFNNTGTNISATTTEGAIKEVNNSLTQLSSKILSGSVSVTASANSYGSTQVNVPWNSTDYTVAMSVGYQNNFTNAVLAWRYKTTNAIQIGFYNNGGSSLTLDVDYVIIKN